MKGHGVKQFFISLKILYFFFQNTLENNPIIKLSASSQLLSHYVFVVHCKLFSRLVPPNNPWDHSKTKVLYTLNCAASGSPRWKSLLKSVDNWSVSFMINLNFDIQNLIDLRSSGIFPKIRSQKKFTKSSTVVFLMGFQKIFMSKATYLILRTVNSNQEAYRDGKRRQVIMIKIKNRFRISLLKKPFSFLAGT